MWGVTDNDNATGVNITTTTCYSQYSWDEYKGTGEWVSEVSPDGVAGAPGCTGDPGPKPEPKRPFVGVLNHPKAIFSPHKIIVLKKIVPLGRQRRWLALLHENNSRKG